MPIKAYLGLQGHGKTYEVVSVVILGALRAGRRVVSNIAGLNFDAMREVLLAEGLQPNQIGSIVSIEHEQPLQAGFWLTDESYKSGKPTFLQPGDLLALDEIWRFWNGFSAKDDDGNKLPASVMNFFRMHRHFPHPETGFTCEIALITQDPGDIGRKVKGVVEQTFLMTKLVDVGMENRYRVDIFNRTNLRAKPIRSIQREYDEKYFGFYKSNSQQKDVGALAVEQTIDSRGNLFKSSQFKYGIPFALIVIGCSIFLGYRFFHRGEEPKEHTTQQEGQKPAPAAATASAKPGTPSQSEWRVVGRFTTDTGMSFYLSDGAGVRVITNPPQYKLSSYSSEVILPDGNVATSWAAPKKTGILPK